MLQKRWHALKDCDWHIRDCLIQIIYEKDWKVYFHYLEVHSVLFHNIPDDKTPHDGRQNAALSILPWIGSEKRRAILNNQIRPAAVRKTLVRKQTESKIHVTAAMQQPHNISNVLACGLIAPNRRTLVITVAHIIETISFVQSQKGLLLWASSGFLCLLT